MNPNGLKLINFNMIWRNSCKIIDYHSIQKVSFVIKFLSISLEKHVFSPIMTKHAEAHWSHCIRRLNCSGEFRKHFCSPLFTELEHCAGGASSKSFRDYAPAILYSSAPSKQIYVPMFKKNFLKNAFPQQVSFTKFPITTFIPYRKLVQTTRVHL